MNKLFKYICGCLGLALSFVCVMGFAEKQGEFEWQKILKEVAPEGEKTVSKQELPGAEIILVNKNVVKGELTSIRKGILYMKNLKGLSFMSEGMNVPLRNVAKIKLVGPFSDVPLSPDQVFLSSGEIVSGKLLSVDEKKVVLKTSYAGELNIKKEQVEAIILSDDSQIAFADDFSRANDKWAICRGKWLMGERVIKQHIPLGKWNVSKGKLRQDMDLRGNYINNGGIAQVRQEGPMTYEWEMEFQSKNRPSYGFFFFGSEVVDFTREEREILAPLTGYDHNAGTVAELINRVKLPSNVNSANVGNAMKKLRKIAGMDRNHPYLDVYRYSKWQRLYEKETIGSEVRVMADNSYVITVQPASRQVYLHSGYLRTARDTKGQLPETDSPHKVKLKVAYDPGTGRINVWANNQMIIDHTKSVPLKSGSYIGFFVNRPAAFDNVRVLRGWHGYCREKREGGKNSDLLHFLNGDTLGGEVSSINKNSISFKTEHGRMSIKREKVSVVVFNAERVVAPAGIAKLVKVDLFNLDRLMLNVKSLDDKYLTGETQYAGVVKIKRSAIKEILMPRAGAGKK